jgi:hypothetical protein
MTNLINSHEYNVFYNYIVPLEQGLVTVHNATMLNTFFETKLGTANVNWRNHNNGGAYYLRFLAPGLEMKTEAINSFNNGNMRVTFEALRVNLKINTNNQNTATYNAIPNDVGVGNIAFTTNPKSFAVINSYSLAIATFNTALTTLTRFVYIGWLREPSYTNGGVGGNTPLGVVAIDTLRAASNNYIRPANVNTTTQLTLSTANNAITNPPITCNIVTPGADATDIVIRDDAAPNYAIGKLYNCVSLPNEAVVGQIWKNTGIDPETGLAYTSSNTDKYLVVMPWGGRKLGMRIWTEGYT